MRDDDHLTLGHLTTNTLDPGLRQNFPQNGDQIMAQNGRAEDRRIG